MGICQRQWTRRKGSRVVEGQPGTWAGRVRQKARYGAHSVHVRQSIPDAGPGFQTKKLNHVKVFPLHSEAERGKHGLKDHHLKIITRIWP